MKRTPLKRNKPIKKRKTGGKATLHNKADKLAREACYARGRCESHDWIRDYGQKKHECSQRFEWAHIKSRGYKSIRHDPKNCVCLCNICHRYFTQNPDEFKRFIDWLDPERWEYLNEQLFIHASKPDPQFWIDYYQSDLPEESA